MKIALFKHIQYGYESVWIYREGQNFDDRVQISDWIDVDFPPLRSGDVIAEQIKALDNIRAEVSRRFAEALQQIDDRKASLLALTHQPETPQS